MTVTAKGDNEGDNDSGGGLVTNTSFDTREDNYLNMLLEIGSAFSEGSNGGMPSPGELYRTNSFAAKLVDMPPDSIRKKLVTYTCTTAEPEDVQRMQEHLDGVADSFGTAVTLSRLFGGSIILMGIQDGAPSWDVPVDEKTVSAIDFLTPLSSQEVQPDNFDLNIFSPNYGSPTHYLIGRERIHASRVLRFDGLNLPRQVMGQSWGDSVLVRPYKHLREFLKTHEGVFCSVKDFNQRVLKLRDLVAKLAAPGGRQRVEDMIRAKARALNAMGIMALDAENEDYSIISRQYQGVLDILKQSAQIFAAAVDFPPSKLLSLFNSSGLASEDTTQARAWADYISSFQRRTLLNPLSRYTHLLLVAQAARNGGNIPKGVKLSFESILEMSKAEEQAIKLEEAQRLDIYLKYQVITAEEVAIALARNTPIESVIDVSSRNIYKPIAQYPEGTTFN